MRDSPTYWRWTGGAMIALAAAFFGIAGGLASARGPEYNVWCSPPMVVGFALVTCAALALGASLSPATFPGVHDLPRKQLGELLHVGNELRVQMFGMPEPSEPFLRELDLWWAEVEATTARHHKYLLPVLRSESGMPSVAYRGHSRIFDERANWLTQRISQLEKVVLSS